MAFATFQQRSVVVDIMKSLLFFFAKKVFSLVFAGQNVLGQNKHLEPANTRTGTPPLNLVVNVNQSAPAVFPWSRNRVTPSLRVRRVQ